MARVLHIGQRKTATTWLQGLANRAQEAGQLKFEHDALARCFRGKNRETFASSDYDEFASLLPSSADAPCFASLESLIMRDPREVARAVGEVWPDAKILITTRAPASYLKSSYASNTLAGGQTSSEKWVKRYSEVHMCQSHNLNLAYEVYSSAFGKENIFFLPFELLRDKSEVYIKRVSAIVGVDLSQFTKEERTNSSPPSIYLFLQRRLSAKIAKHAPEVLNSAEWHSFVRAANHAARSSVHIERYITTLTEHRPELKGNIPDLPAEALNALGTNMTILREFPVYRRYADIYGLDG